ATEENMSHYEVEYSRNGTQFAKGVKVDAKNTSPADYEWWHMQPGEGNHFYRVRAIDHDGKNLLSRIVKVNIGAGKPDFKVYPTVVSTSPVVTMELTSLKKGNYTVQVTLARWLTIRADPLRKCSNCPMHSVQEGIM
ncbi:MAG: hypothetical protein MUE71_01970, partial [Chitinophagaceae bacterium]|nr:hypothetical protein [Chitinophagaceae bacterium]